MMRRLQVLVFVAGAAVVGSAGLVAVPGCSAVPGGPVRAAGSVRRAIEVPGLGALNRGGNAGINEVSCASAGNCAAGGFYTDGHRHSQGFAVAERHGVWGNAIEVPGLAALNRGGNAEVTAVSCRPAGNCAAIGDYKDRSGRSQGFVVAERNGAWGQAVEMPGLGALNQGGNAAPGEVACVSAGNCAAIGDYEDRSRNTQGFVVAEQNGAWGQAVEIPGLGALNQGGNADVSDISCASAGNCAAVGDYTDQHQNQQGFAVAEKNGVWGKAIEVPGLEALNQGGQADVYSVSCVPPGSICVAGGDYTDSGSSGQGFAVAGKNGRWGKATDLPGLRALNQDAGAEVDTVSCASAGNCAAGGTYGYPYTGVFLAVEKNGVWGQAADAGLPGRIAGVNSVSCASPGNCAAGGTYSDDTGAVFQGWVAVERHGTWGQPADVPGLTALNTGEGAEVDSVSCPPAGSCAAAGSYTDYTHGHQHSQGFVLSQTR